jgi:hypothetical protein
MINRKIIFFISKVYHAEGLWVFGQNIAAACYSR